MFSPSVLAVERPSGTQAVAVGLKAKLVRAPPRASFHEDTALVDASNTVELEPRASSHRARLASTMSNTGVSPGPAGLYLVQPVDEAGTRNTWSCGENPVP